MRRAENIKTKCQEACERTGWGRGLRLTFFTSFRHRNFLTIFTCARGAVVSERPRSRSDSRPTRAESARLRPVLLELVLDNCLDAVRIRANDLRALESRHRVSIPGNDSHALFAPLADCTPKLLSRPRRRRNQTGQVA